MECPRCEERAKLLAGYAANLQPGTVLEARETSSFPQLFSLGTAVANLIVAVMLGLAMPAVQTTQHDIQPEFVDEANIVGKFDSTEALGKAYPRIVIDGVKCEYDPAQKWFVHAEYGCRVMWMEIGSDKMLMSRHDWRASNGEPFKNKDGDLQLITLPLQIMKEGRWIDLRPGDVIHRNAAICWNLQTEAETPAAGTYRRIGNSLRWAVFDGKQWSLADTHDLPPTIKSGL